MHEPGPAGGVGHVIRFLDLQGVHIGAEADCRPSLAQVTNDSRLAHACLYLKVHRLKGVTNEPGSLVFLKAQFGMPVNGAAPGHNLFTERSGS
jgi:hypothetical protein